MSYRSGVNFAAPAPRFSRRRQWASRQAISFLMQQGVENPDVISLAAGLVDPHTLPVEATRMAFEQLLTDTDRARQALQYGTTLGAETLRRQLLKHLARLEGLQVEDLGIASGQLVLTTGSQQLLSLVGEVLLDPDDICLVAAPTYFVFLGVLEGLAARTIPVATDADGMCIDALQSQLEQLDGEGLLERVKLIYLVSYYENPSGVSLSAERRREVVELVRRWSQRNRIFVLEDAAYRELRYDGPELPSIWSYDSGRDFVILAQTFSKSFAPGLRVGYGVLPQTLAEPICDRKGNEDFGSANLNQHLVAKVLEEGLYAGHVDKLRVSYRAKRDSMLAAAEKYFDDLPGVRWVHPHGGLYVWMTLPESIDTGFDGELFRRATKVEKMMYVPGDLCFPGPPDDRPRNQIRLSFGVEDPAGIELGMRRLANAIRAVI
jgi:2-aminoadipate transaminase